MSCFGHDKDPSTKQSVDLYVISRVDLFQRRERALSDVMTALYAPFICDAMSCTRNGCSYLCVRSSGRGSRKAARCSLAILAHQFGHKIRCIS